MSQDGLASFGDPREHEGGRGAVELGEDVEGGTEGVHIDKGACLLK